MAERVGFSQDDSQNPDKDGPFQRNSHDSSDDLWISSRRPPSGTRIGAPQFSSPNRSCMQPEDRDPGYLWDMLDAARAIRDFTVDVTLDEYLRDRKLQLAVERAIEIIGEAARLCLRPSRRSLRRFPGNRSSRSATEHSPHLIHGRSQMPRTNLFAQAGA